PPDPPHPPPRRSSDLFGRAPRHAPAEVLGDRCGRKDEADEYDHPAAIQREAQSYRREGAPPARRCVHLAGEEVVSKRCGFPCFVRHGPYCCSTAGARGSYVVMEFD